MCREEMDGYDRETVQPSRQERDMIDEPHVEDCQGCVANRLTEADRAHLIAHGWTYPGHTYRVPDEMPPRPPQVNPVAPLAWFFGIPLGGVTLYLTIDQPIYGVVVGGATVLWLLLSNHHHHRNHPRLDRPLCQWCNRRAARIWTHYDDMKSRQARRALYTEYQRLQEDERRYD